MLEWNDDVYLSFESYIKRQSLLINQSLDWRILLETKTSTWRFSSHSQSWWEFLPDCFSRLQDLKCVTPSTRKKNHFGVPFILEEKTAVKRFARGLGPVDGIINIQALIRSANQTFSDHLVTKWGKKIKNKKGKLSKSTNSGESQWYSDIWGWIIIK